MMGSMRTDGRGDRQVRRFLPISGSHELGLEQGLALRSFSFKWQVYKNLQNRISGTKYFRDTFDFFEWDILTPP